MHQFNRAFLLALPVLAGLLPWLLGAGAQGPVLTVRLPEMLAQGASEPLLETSGKFSIYQALLAIWMLGLLIRALITWRGFRQVSRLMRAESIEHSFTFLGRIYLESGLSDAEREKILFHESVHARQWHSLDLLWMEGWSLLFWFNPVLPMVRSSLKELHEYIADRAADAASDDYAETLVAKAFGLSRLPLANEFQSNNIKQRVMMMNKERSKRAGLRALVALGALVLGGLCISFTGLHTDKVYEKVDQMPAFKGCDVNGLEGKDLEDCSMRQLIAYMMEAVVYPKEEEKEGIEGVVAIEYVVSAEGEVKDAKVLKSVNPALDAAALKVVRDMPEWNPGVHEGKQVSVKMVLPIKFALAK